MKRLVRRGLRNRHLLLLDALLLPAATLLAYVIRFEGLDWGMDQQHGAVVYILTSLPIKLGICLSLGLYQRLWRYASVVELERLLLAVLGAGASCFVLGALALPGLQWTAGRVPLSILIMDGFLMAAVLAFPRLLLRIAGHRLQPPPLDDARRVLIAGAGSAGGMIVNELRANPQLGLNPVGFVDDDVTKHHHRMFDLPVFAALTEIRRVIRQHDIQEIIIAMPTAPGTVVREVVRSAAEAKVATRIVPGIFDIISGKLEVTSLRQVEIQDLLRREPVETNLDLVRTLATGETVLVTGAGGSIGSELCRQLARLGPARIVLLGHGENSIFDVLRELDEHFPSVRIEAVIADIRDRDHMARIFTRFRPYTVFHTAAHKHVPLMETNVAEAVTNNILGTKNVVELSAEGRVEHLVLISTDKAVRPTSIMGATKRVAKQIVQHTAEEMGRNFVAVRFGNVLGSRGSVVPTFLRQIAEGGPVTVTHPEMRRYFMTIPESVQLVLQAGALGRGGEVFVLDMGEPVKVADLAADLIRLSGREVGRDIEIRFTGARPGERLYEELFFSEENAVRTGHPKVLRARNAVLPTGVRSGVDDLIAAAHDGWSEQELVELLKRLVPDFDPSRAGAPVKT